MMSWGDWGTGGQNTDEQQQAAQERVNQQAAQQQPESEPMPGYQQPSLVPPTETPGVTQPGTLLGQLQAERYNPADPTAGNVASDTSSKLLGAAATAAPMIAFGPAQSAAGLGIQAAGDQFGLPAPVTNALSLTPFTEGGIGTRLAQAAGGGALGYGAQQLPQGPEIPGLGGVPALAGTVGGMYLGGLGASALSRIDPLAGIQAPRAPEMANPTPLTPSPAGGAPLPGENPLAPNAGQSIKEILQRAREDNIAAGVIDDPLGIVRPATPTRGMTPEEVSRQAGYDMAKRDPNYGQTQYGIGQQGITGPGDLAAGNTLAQAHWEGVAQAQAERLFQPEAANPARFGGPDYPATLGHPAGEVPTVPPTPAEVYARIQAGGGQPPEAGAAQVPSLNPPPAAALSPDEVSRLGSRQLVSRDIAGGAAKLEFKQVPDGTIDVTFRGEPGLSGFREMGVHIDAVRQAFPDTPLTVEATDARRTGAYQRMGFEPSDRYVVPGAQPILEMKPLSQTGSTERYTPEQQATNQAQAVSRGYMPAPGQTSGEAVAFRDSQNGVQMGAQRAIANGEPGQMPAGAQPTTSGNSGLPSPASSGHGGAGAQPPQGGGIVNPSPSGGIDWNPIHNLMSAIGAPTQPLLTGLHFARFAPQQLFRPGAIIDGMRAMGEAARSGRFDDVRDDIASRQGNIPAGSQLADLKVSTPARPDPTAVQWLINHSPVGPVLNRFREVNSAMLGGMRDSAYVANADRLARTDPGANPEMYKDLWREANNSTGHQTLIGNPDALNVSQNMGVGWSALLARVQELGNTVIGSGAPVPGLAAGSRAEAFKSLMGVAGTMVGATALGKVLGANVNLTQPFNTFGLESSFAKPVTNNGLYKTVYGTGGAGYDTLFKAAANIGNDLFNGDEKAALNHALAFARGEFGVVPAGVIDGILGQKWNGQPYQWRDFLNEAKTGFMADEKGEFGAGRSVPIAAGENYQAVKAYGPEGLLRALPADIASSVQTTPINTGSQAFKYAAPPDIIQKAYPESPLLQDALKGKDWNELLPNEKKQVTDTLGRSNPELAKQIQDQSRTQNPASAAHGDVITALQDRKTGAENYLLDLYNSGKMDKPTLRGAFHTVENDYYNSKAKADADPAYQVELAKFKNSGTDPSKAQQYVDAYYQISQHFADNKVERQAQEAKYIQWVNSQDPHMAVRLVAAIQPKNQTELEKMYASGALSGR